MFYIYSNTSAGQLIIESSTELSAPAFSDSQGRSILLPLLTSKECGGKFITTFDASSLTPWSPNHPELYNFSSGTETRRFGYCQLEVSGNRDILLNGTPCFLRGYIRGIVAHEHPNMTGLSLKEAARKNIRQAQKYGFNLVRFHSTIPSPEFVEAADEEGLFIHMEIGFAYEYDSQGNKKKLSMDNRCWEETILQYRNHPSVAIFCIGNEMHNAGHHKEVAYLYELGKRLAPSKLIMDNSGWGEYDRESADIFSQHIAYYYPYKHHAEMFNTDDCWRLNGSTYDEALESDSSCSAGRVHIRREATPIRPVLAHEAIHYIDIPDYQALNKKFDDFCARVGKDYLEANGIKKPRYLTELPELIERKKLTSKLPDYIAGSQIFKKMGIKTYLEKLRFSKLCGFEMLQFADCLKYENKNGIVDFFDDDKYIDPEWMKRFNGDAALLAELSDETFYDDTPAQVSICISNFLESPRRKGTLTITLNGETVWEGKNFVLAGAFQCLARLTINFKKSTQPAKMELYARFCGDGIDLENSWPLWVYPRAAVKAAPQELNISDPELQKFLASASPAENNLYCTDILDDTIFEKLAAGRHVILIYHRDKPGNKYYWPGTLERFKPCIWDRGSNLGGMITAPVFNRATAAERYFEANMQPLLEGAYKINLDEFPVQVSEFINGIDKPVRDRMKGLIHHVKDFIPSDTLRNFSHCFSVAVNGGGLLTVCTLSPVCWQSGPVTDSFFAALINEAPALTSDHKIDPALLKDYLKKSTEAGVIQEDVMNHFWEIDNKPVEDTLFWEATGIDLSKLK